MKVPIPKKLNGSATMRTIVIRIGPIMSESLPRLACRIHYRQPFEALARQTRSSIHHRKLVSKSKIQYEVVSFRSRY